MHRFYCRAQDISASTISLTDKSVVHHIKDVLRLKEGEEIVVCDQRAHEYLAVIEGIHKKAILAKIIRKNFQGAKNISRFSIACALPKQTKFDDIVNKLTQLGVNRIIPMHTQRVIVKLDSHKELLRLNRWQKIAQSASQQSQRPDVAIIEPVTDFTAVLARAKGYSLKLIPTLTGKRVSLRNALGAGSHNAILAMIGPEGDFSAQETALAIKAGFIPISLGPLVLRVDTACIAVASFIRLLHDENS